MTGQQFGNWAVLEFVPDNTGKSRWLCECSCKNKTQKILRREMLISGESKSCGCSRRNEKELIGKQFGRWTVLDFYSYGQKIYWLCQCSCEKETIRPVRGNDLKTGSSKSCGCLQRERTAEASTKDLLNKTFNRLTVIEKTDRRNDNKVVWKCQCSCDNKTIIEVNSAKLISGNTKSCGCLISETNMSNILGKIFGKLTVIEQTDKRNGTSVVWKCRCSCLAQTVIEVSSKSLLSGNTKSCGCIKSIGNMYINKILKENNIKYIPEYTFDNLRTRKNGIPRFDFGVFDFNNNLHYLIEFDGIQHFHDVFSFKNKEDFEYGKEKDILKNEYCFKNNIQLIRIPYWERDNLSMDMLIPNTSKYLIKNSEDWNNIFKLEQLYLYSLCE